MPRGTLRVGVSILLGIVTAFGLFWGMQALISVSGELQERARALTLDFVRLRRDTTPQTKEREKPQRQKPEQQPAPPDMNMAQNIAPGDAVGEIAPMVDTAMELEAATDIAAGSSDRGIVPLVRVDPDYPPRAKQQRIEGYVEVEFTISPAGTVQNPVVIGSDPAYIFDRAALQAVRRWRYSPKTEGGVPVPRPGVRVRLRFELPKGR